MRNIIHIKSTKKHRCSCGNTPPKNTMKFDYTKYHTQSTMFRLSTELMNCVRKQILLRNFSNEKPNKNCAQRRFSLVSLQTFFKSMAKMLQLSQLSDFLSFNLLILQYYILV